MKLILPVLGLTVLAVGVLFWHVDAFAQDETITNADQLAAVIDQSGLYFPLASVTEPPLSWPALGVFWADFSQLTNAIGDVRNFEAETQYGISVWHLRLTRTADAITFSYAPADTNLLELAASEDGFSNHYEKVLWTWCILGAVRNYEPYDDLIADGYTNLAPKRLVLDILLGDVNDCSTYEANASGDGMFMMTSGEDSGDDLTPSFGIDGDPCSITNLMQPFQVVSINLDTNRFTTITWESCPRFLYGVFSAEALSTDTVWTSRAYLWGSPATTSWTDVATTNMVQRFYKVERLGMDSWAMVLGVLTCCHPSPSGIHGAARRRLAMW